MPEFTTEYLREEVARFREAMGTKTFWADVEKAGRAMFGLLYVYSNTKDFTEKEIVMMQATTDEYDRRLAYVMLSPLFKRSKNV